MVARNARELDTLLAKLRREHVREYEEDEAGNVRVVFDDSAFTAAPAAAKKDKEKARRPLALVALGAPTFNPDEPAG